MQLPHLKQTPEALCAGLQGLSLEAALNNLEITGNPRLVDISALDAVVNCSDPTMAMDSLGVIEVFPANRQQPSSCFLTSVGQVLEYPSGFSECAFPVVMLGRGIVIE